MAVFKTMEKTKRPLSLSCNFLRLATQELKIVGRPYSNLHKRRLIQHVCRESIYNGSMPLKKNSTPFCGIEASVVLLAHRQLSQGVATPPGRSRLPPAWKWCIRGNGIVYYQFQEKTGHIGIPTLIEL